MPVLEVVDPASHRNESARGPARTQGLDLVWRRFLIVGSVKDQHGYARRGRTGVEVSSEEHDPIRFGVSDRANRRHGSGVFGDQHQAGTDVEPPRTPYVGHCGAHIAEITVIDGEPGETTTLQDIK